MSLALTSFKVAGTRFREGMRIAKASGKDVVTVESKENQRSEQEMQSLVPVLLLNA